jgi:Fe-S-cluster containining protein
MCGKCCKNLSNECIVILLPNDIQNIASHLHIDIETFIRFYVNADKLIIRDKIWFSINTIKHIDGRCVFLSDDNLCKIHEFKPIQCSRGPLNFFWNKSIKNELECINKTDVPEDWNTSDLDKEFIEQIVKS